MIPILHLPITVAVRSKTRNAFTRSNTGIVGLNPTEGMNVCLFIMFALGSGLAMS
jgi:hypothetical protein